MRRVFSVAVLGFAVVASTGCEEKKKASPEPAPSATAASTASASASASAAASSSAAPAASAATDAGKADAHMANCPTATPGASVAVKDVEGGVEVSITGKDDAATKDIRTRVTKLVEADRNEGEAGVKHTGRGEGGGVYGRCTIVMRNTKLDAAEIPGGSKVTVKAKDKSEVDWLRRETRDRDKEAKAPGAEAAGAQRMSHCPSAVPGATTKVKDIKEGIVVTVTGSGDAVKEIRERAKHTAAVAKMPQPQKVMHTGEGQGGGGLGRCPIIVEGDTAVDVKDVDNGVEATVKTTKDVAALQKEAKLRAGNFGAKP